MCRRGYLGRMYRGRSLGKPLVGRRLWGYVQGSVAEGVCQRVCIRRGVSEEVYQRGCIRGDVSEGVSEEGEEKEVAEEEWDSH